MAADSVNATTFKASVLPVPFIDVVPSVRLVASRDVDPASAVDMFSAKVAKSLVASVRVTVPAVTVGCARGRDGRRLRQCARDVQSGCVVRCTQLSARSSRPRRWLLPSHSLCRSRSLASVQRDGTSRQTGVSGNVQRGILSHRATDVRGKSAGYGRCPFERHTCGG